jgi:hypothetical protein
MKKGSWARGALLVLTLPACASAYGASSPPATPSLAAGQAAQPASFIAGGARQLETGGCLTPERTSEGHAAGQAAQPGSWLTPAVTPAPTGQTPVAHEGPSYLGGRAAQPHSWIQASTSACDLRQPAGRL